MPKKNPAPITAYEFALRRRAAGLDNATLMEMLGCSISSVTKWSSGVVPVSVEALEALEAVEEGIEFTVKVLLDQHGARPEDGMIEIPSEPFTGWRLGKSVWEMAVARARYELAPARITPPPSA